MENLGLMHGQRELILLSFPAFPHNILFAFLYHTTYLVVLLIRLFAYWLFICSQEYKLHEGGAHAFQITFAFPWTNTGHSL